MFCALLPCYFILLEWLVKCGLLCFVKRILRTCANFPHCDNLILLRNGNRKHSVRREAFVAFIGLQWYVREFQFITEKLGQKRVSSCFLILSWQTNISWNVYSYTLPYRYSWLYQIVIVKPKNMQCDLVGFDDFFFRWLSL